MTMSMTGFARQESQFDWGRLSCEIRSVNHRYLELFVKTPESLRYLEMDLREKVKHSLSRGKIELQLHLKTEEGGQQSMALNHALVDRLSELLGEIKAGKASSALGELAAVSPVDILRWPGVLQTDVIDTDELNEAAVSLVTKTLQLLKENRQREGVELNKLIEERLDGIAANVKSVRALMPEILEHHQQKLRAKLEGLQVELDEDRFTQELVYSAQKSDVAEELDRLEAHLIEVRNTLKESKPIGRRLDFLMQELNREANTLSSKSMSSDTTQISVDLKVLIEQMREQIQNIE